MVTVIIKVFCTIWHSNVFFFFCMLFIFYLALHLFDIITFKYSNYNFSKMDNLSALDLLKEEMEIDDIASRVNTIHKIPIVVSLMAP